MWRYSQRVLSIAYWVLSIINWTKLTWPTFLGEKPTVVNHRWSESTLSKLIYIYTSWKQHKAKQLLYGNLPPILKLIQLRRTRHVDIAGEARVNSYDVLLWTPTHERASVGRPAKRRDIIWKTCRERWRDRQRERELGKSTLSGRLDDDDDDNGPVYVCLCLFTLNYVSWWSFARIFGAVQYTDCISTEGLQSSNVCPG